MLSCSVTSSSGWRRDRRSLWCVHGWATVPVSSQPRLYIYYVAVNSSRWSPPPRRVAAKPCEGWSLVKLESHRVRFFFLPWVRHELVGGLRGNVEREGKGSPIVIYVVSWEPGASSKGQASGCFIRKRKYAVILRWVQAPRVLGACCTKRSSTHCHFCVFPIENRRRRQAPLCPRDAHRSQKAHALERRVRGGLLLLLLMMMLPASENSLRRKSAAELFRQHATS